MNSLHGGFSYSFGAGDVAGAKKRGGKKAAAAAAPTGGKWDPLWCKERVARPLGMMLSQDLMLLFGSHAPMDRMVNLASQIAFRCALGSTQRMDVSFKPGN